MTQLALGLARKQRGMERMECVDSEWIYAMRIHAKAISLAMGRVTVDGLRVIAAQHRSHPSKEQSWGCIFRGKHWMYLGQEMSHHASNHGRRITVWRWID